MAEQKKQNLADPKVRKRFVTYKEASELYSRDLTRVQEHARSVGATYKMGNKVVFWIVTLFLYDLSWQLFL